MKSRFAIVLALGACTTTHACDISEVFSSVLEFSSDMCSGLSEMLKTPISVINEGGNLAINIGECMASLPGLGFLECGALLSGSELLPVLRYGFFSFLWATFHWWSILGLSDENDSSDENLKDDEKARLYRQKPLKMISHMYTFLFLLPKLLSSQVLGGPGTQLFAPFMNLGAVPGEIASAILIGLKFAAISSYILPLMMMLFGHSPNYMFARITGLSAQCIFGAASGLIANVCLL